MMGPKKIWTVATGWLDRDWLAFSPRPSLSWQLMIISFGILLVVVIVSHIGLYLYWQSAGRPEVVQIETEELPPDLLVDELRQIMDQLGPTEVFIRTDTPAPEVDMDQITAPLDEELAEDLELTESEEVN